MPPPLTLASSSQASASHTWQSDTLAALSDSVEPKSSQDSDIPRFTWWPHKGSEEWVQYTFESETSVGETAVYWFDDNPHGGCRPPMKWEILYAKEKSWLPVKNKSPYETTLNQYNVVSFEPVSTTAIRLVVQLQQEYSGGILEWKITESK